MKVIVLEILAQDILETSYMYSSDCAITRALKRAGLDMEDSGTEIVHVSRNLYGDVVNTNEAEYLDLVQKVLKSYCQKRINIGEITKPFDHEDIAVEDFKHSLTFLDLE
jgi:hypothetical protein